MVHKYKLLHLLGPDATVLLLIWLLYMLTLWPLALMHQWKLCIVSTPMSIGLAITFIAFSVGRGTTWLVMGFMALVASIAGTMQGIYLRIHYPVLEEYLPLKYPITLLQAVFIPAGVLLVVLLVAAPILRLGGCRIVGSTDEYRKKMASHMVFGTSVYRNLEQAQEGGRHLMGLDENVVHSSEVKEAGMLLKLHDDLHFSGEPIYDFAFWLANQHLMMGVIFHHPLSPLDTGHRLVILIVTCFMIVCPVALVTVLWPKVVPSYVPGQGIFRLIFMALVVIIPRNKMKDRMKNIAIQDEQRMIDMRASRRDTTDMEKAKERMVRKEVLLYGVITLFTVSFCWLAWHFIAKEGDEEPLTLFLLNVDGLGFCFVLEILFALIMPKPSKNQERKCLGWWGRWHDERACHLSLNAQRSADTELS